MDLLNASLLALSLGIDICHVNGQLRLTEDIQIAAMVKSKGLSKYFEREAQLQGHVVYLQEGQEKSFRHYYGDYRGQFGQISDYVWEVYKQNTGSTVKVKSQKAPQGLYIFRFLYICPGLLKKGFLDGCRRVLSSDAYFLNGPWDGQLFCAVGRDANDQISLVPWSVAQSEKKETWG